MQDWMIVVVIAVIVIFGASKLPQLARNVGKAQTEFKKGLKEGASEADDDQPAPAPSTPPAAATPQDSTPPPATEQPQPPTQA
jgi:sec-independent protein translocase protein TatA